MFKVVIADDEKKVVQLMQKLIDWENAGYEIVGTANDGVSALSLVEELKPDLLVTDIRMPGISGIELLKKAKELNPGLLCIVVSGYREFEYAQSALKYGVEDYLLKPLNKNEMTELLHKIRAKLTNGAEMEYQRKLNERRKQELLIRKLKESADNGADFENLETINREYGFRFEEGDSVVVLVKTDIPEAIKYPQNYRVLTEHTLESVRKYAAAVANEWAAAILPEGIALLMNAVQFEIPELKKTAVRIRKEIERERDLVGDVRVTICLGSIVKEFSGLSASLREAIFLCEDRLCVKENIRIAADEKITCSEKYQMEAEERKALQEAIELLSDEEYRLALKDSYAKLIYHGGVNGRYIRSWYEEIIDLALFCLSPFAVEGKRIKSELEEHFWQCSASMEVLELVEQSICRILRELKTEKESKEAKPITEAKRYIREHYKEALRLEDVSSAVGFNATYFSSLFKKETGMNFMDYLTELRMSKAKELLSSGELSLNDVAEQVGYRDLKYFSRLFKKATGINPSEYKKLYS